MSFKRWPFKNVVIFYACISIASISTLANANNYWVVTDLGSLDKFGATANSINDGGQVVGVYYTSTSFHAFLTAPNGIGLTDLGENVNAYNINVNGQVVGDTLTTNHSHAFITGYNGSGINDLGALDGIGSSRAIGINNLGQVVGVSVTSTGYGLHAFITGFNGTGMLDLGTLGGFESYAYGINDLGMTVGMSSTAIGHRHAFITDANGFNMTDLGTLGGYDSIAFGINNLGQVVGNSQTINGNDHAFVTGVNGVGMIDLGTFGGLNSTANSINNLGEVVGSAQIANGDYHAYLFSNGAMTDLSLIPSLIPTGWGFVPLDINNSGQIVGYRMNELDGKTEAILLSPIPEPKIHLMLLIGIAIVAFMTKYTRYLLLLKINIKTDKHNHISLTPMSALEASYLLNVDVITNQKMN